MGSKSKKSGGGGVTSAAAGQQTAPQQYSYGGTNMTQQEAQAKYQADMNAWRAPTATGTGKRGMDTGVITQAAPTDAAGTGHLGVPTTNWHATGLGGGGPALPAMGVLPTAPVVVPRQTLAQVMYRQPQYVGGRGGDRSSSGQGYAGGGPGGSHGFGGATGSATGGAGRGSSARSGGLY